MKGVAHLANPAHFFKYDVAIGLRFLSIQVIGIRRIIANHARQGLIYTNAIYLEFLLSSKVCRLKQIQHFSELLFDGISVLSTIK